MSKARLVFSAFRAPVRLSARLIAPSSAWLGLAAVFLLPGVPAAAQSVVTVKSVAQVRAGAGSNPFYVSNRAPLAPSPLIKLPIGSITPAGWLRRQLELERDGMTGHLEELSKWCQFDGNAWTSPDGEGDYGWEEVPYWLKGYGDLGYVLKDDTIIREARKWIDGVLSSQQHDGFFGPCANKTGLDGAPDLWPHMVMLNVLQSFYEATHDERVPPFITCYLHWLNTLAPAAFSKGYWPKIRFGDTIETAYWLFNRTGDASLLDLAAKIHQNMQDWTSGVHNWHNVNIAQGFREPAIYYCQAKDATFLDAAEHNYDTVMGLYGQFPGGGFAGDENCRSGFTDPRQGFETCGIVEFMHSFEMLTKISGDPIWSDRCEEIAFNSFPAAIAPDWKGLHYLTCANQVQLDKADHHPGINNGGMMFAYSPFEAYRCCQHNVSHGWPYFSEELWLATADRGLCASLFAPCNVSAKVAGGSAVEISEETDYPFGDTITLRISAAAPARFPLYLRIPRWCENPRLKINGKTHRWRAGRPSYVLIERQWNDRDTITLQLPMRVRLKRWATNHNALSVAYGPLEFSLKIAERWQRNGGTDAWPEYEVFPGNPWNFGLVLWAPMAARSFKVIKTHPAALDNPFTQQTVPIEVKVRAKRIPSWGLDDNGLAGLLPQSPAAGAGRVETVTLIPMGAARLRISMFPLISKPTSLRSPRTQE
jgi:hypothetical protein